MNSVTLSKLNLFLGGVMARLLENRDWFSFLSADFKSGGKTYPLYLSLEEEGFSCNYLGSKTIIEEEEILSFLLEEGKKYDEVLFTYEDRLGRILITADVKGVQTKMAEGGGEKPAPKTATVGGRNYIIKETEAPALLAAIGILTPEGKIKNDMVRKYNQIDRFVELISDIPLTKDFTVLDCACGKSYLSFVLNDYYTRIRKNKCRVYGIDYQEGVIQSSRKMAKSLGYQNMEFIQADLTKYSFPGKVDLVVSLHACDTATDYALATGVRNHAGAIVCVPCCHKELSTQIQFDPLTPVLKHGILNRRFADVLTDGLRALLLESYGYQVSVIEYTSPLDTPKNIMLKAVKKGGRNEKAFSEYQRLKDLFQVRPTLEYLLQDYN